MLENAYFFRHRKNYSVNKLATLSGISQSYLRDIELGNKNPTIEILSYICEALNISLREFLMSRQMDNFVMIHLLLKYTA